MFTFRKSKLKRKLLDHKSLRSCTLNKILARNLAAHLLYSLASAPGLEPGHRKTVTHGLASRCLTN